MNDRCVSCAQTYATFYIHHPDLDPEVVSRELGIEATETWRRGEPKNPRAIRPVMARFGRWTLRTPTELDPRDVVCHMEWLLDRLEPRRAALRRLQEAGCSTGVSCFWVSRPLRGCQTLPASTLGRLADLRLELEFDVYFQQEEELLNGS